MQEEKAAGLLFFTESSSALKGRAVEVQFLPHIVECDTIDALQDSIFYWPAKGYNNRPLTTAREVDDAHQTLPTGRLYLLETMC